MSASPITFPAATASLARLAAADAVRADAEAATLQAHTLVLDRILEDAQAALADLRDGDVEGGEVCIAAILIRIRALREPARALPGNVVSLAARAGRAVDAR